MEIKGNCAEGVGGPARRPEGREGQRVEKHRQKQENINRICVCKCHKEAHLCVNFKKLILKKRTK